MYRRKITKKKILDETPENKRNDHIKIRNSYNLYYEEQITKEMIKRMLPRSF